MTALRWLVPAIVPALLLLALVWRSDKSREPVALVLTTYGLGALFGAGALYLADWASWRIEIFACSRCSLMYSPIEFTVTLRMPSVCHRMLATANPEQAVRPGGWGGSGLAVADAEEGACIGRAHGGTLR